MDCSQVGLAATLRKTMFEINNSTQELTPVVPLSSVPAIGDPQFSTAEYAQTPGTDRCRICGNLIAGEYYRVNNQMACATCAQQAQAGQPADSHAAYLRGLLLGIGAAIVGLAAYATFTVVTGWYLGYIALGVGWFVAKAIAKGSNGLGGRRYQITAVLLTYTAISMAAIPIGISYAIKHEQPKAIRKSSDNPFPGENNSVQPSETQPKQEVHLGAFAGQLLLLGLASPFMALQDPFHGAIGLFILFIGLRIAWQLTAAKRLEVDGPFSLANTP
jgi:hypothetical protein